MPHERTTRTGGTGRNGHRTVTFHDVPDAPAAASRARAQAGAHAQSGARDTRAAAKRARAPARLRTRNTRETVTLSGFRGNAVNHRTEGGPMPRERPPSRRERPERRPDHDKT